MSAPAVLSLQVAALDGTTRSVTVPQPATVGDVKQTYGDLRGMSADLIELFVQGRENSLKNEDRLDEVGVLEGKTVFFACMKQGWRWETCGSNIALNGCGLTATKKTSTTGWNLVTGGERMTEGQHYWEVQLKQDLDVRVGAVRPDLDHDKDHSLTTDAYYINLRVGSLYGNGKRNDKTGLSPQQSQCAIDDHVGVLLDLDTGCLRFYLNGKPWGPGFSGVTGPLVRAAAMLFEHSELTVLPGAAAPED